MKSIGTKLIALFTITTIIVCGGLSLISYRHSSKSLTEGIHERLPERAEDAAKLVDERLKGYLSEVEILSKRDRLRDMGNSWEDKLKILNPEIERNGYITMGIADLNGNLKLVSGEQVEIRDRDYFQHSLSGKSFITEPFLNRADGKLVFAVSAPLQDDSGKIVGVLMSSIDASVLTDLVLDLTFGQNGYAYMVDDDGAVIGHQNKDLVLEHYSPIEEAKSNPDALLLAELHKRMVAGERGFGDYRFQGEDKFMGFAPIKSTNWAIAVTAPKDEVFAPINNLRNSLAISTIIALTVGILIASNVSRPIVRLIVQATEYAERVAEGDLTIQISDRFLTLDGEIGRLAQALHKMINNLRSDVTELVSISEYLTSSSQQLSATTESSAADMQEVSAATEEISASLEEVSASAEQISASGQEMNASLENLNDEIQAGNERSKEIETRAISLQENAVSSQQTAIQMYQDIYRKITNAMEEAKIVNEISAMASLIANIAEQTNLLALNAAIEAARAGEAGRGFAVVAEEVRKLAEESATTVASIQTLTKQVQSSIGNLVQDANELLSFVNTNVIDDYNKFVEVSGQYKEDADVFNNLTQKTAMMSNQVLTVVNEVSNAIQLVAVSVNQSSTGAQQIAEKTDHTANSLVEINEASSKLAKMAEEIQSMISYFKLS